MVWGKLVKDIFSREGKKTCQAPNVTCPHLWRYSGHVPISLPSRPRRTDWALHLQPTTTLTINLIRMTTTTTSTKATTSPATNHNFDSIWLGWPMAIWTSECHADTTSEPVVRIMLMSSKKGSSFIWRSVKRKTTWTSSNLYPYHLIRLSLYCNDEWYGFWSWYDDHLGVR